MNAQPCLHGTQGQDSACAGRYTPCNYSPKLAADILSAYHMPDIVLGSGHTAVNKRNKAPVFMVFPYYNILAAL